METSQYNASNSNNIEIYSRKQNNRLGSHFLLFDRKKYKSFVFLIEIFSLLLTLISFRSFNFVIRHKLGVIQRSETLFRSLYTLSPIQSIYNRGSKKKGHPYLLAFIDSFVRIEKKA